MKKVILSLLAAGALTLVVATEKPAPSNEKAVATASTQSDAYAYAGGGIGASYYRARLSEDDYALTGKNSNGLTGKDLKSLDNRGASFLVYGGYQFNKIIAVEASFTDFGNFAGSKNGRTYSRDPQALAVYASGGYMFFNNSLRPFMHLGLSYVMSNQNAAYDDLDFTDNYLAMHSGIGVDYYPAILKGVGLRASYGHDFGISSYEMLNGSNLEDELLVQNIGLFYLGAQYRF